MYKLLTNVSFIVWWIYGAVWGPCLIYSWPQLLRWVPEPTIPPHHPLICATCDLSKVGKNQETTGCKYVCPLKANAFSLQHSDNYN